MRPSLQVHVIHVHAYLQLLQQYLNDQSHNHVVSLPCHIRVARLWESQQYNEWLYPNVQVHVSNSKLTDDMNEIEQCIALDNQHMSEIPSLTTTNNFMYILSDFDFRFLSPTIVDRATHMC